MSRSRGFKKGDRVRLVRDVERYPHFIAPRGTTGSVTFSDLAAGAAIRLLVLADKKIRGAEEWQNQIEWAYDDDPADDLELVETPPPPPTKRSKRAAVARRIHVTFEAAHRFPTIRGWSFGELWNGWEVPYFEYREAKKVATALTQDGMVTIYDAPTDSFYSFAHGEGSEPTQAEFNRIHDKNLWYDWEPVTIQTTEGSKKAWSIGGMAFTWEQSLSN